MTVYKTKVNNIGEEAELFQEEKMVILFGENAPAELAEYCYNIQVNPIEGHITVGQHVYFGDVPFEITAVGDVVEKNLQDLGHITIKFNGESNAELGGTLYVEDKEMPEVNIGTKISIQ